MGPGIIPDDLIRPFQIEGMTVRGRLVRLGPTLHQILTRHDYPDLVSQLLGQAVALSSALAGALKYNGVFTLQTKGDGPLSIMVADVKTPGDLRGYAQFDADAIAAVQPNANPSIPRLLGAGHIAFTVDQGTRTERYQGIVALEGQSLADCAHNYFRESEQIETAIVLACGKALGGCGAFVAGSDTLVKWLVNRSRPFIFTTATPPLLLAMMAAGLELCADPAPRARGHSLARRLRDALAAGGLDCSGSTGPIVPVIVGGNEDALEAADRLQQAGLDVRAVRPPTVAPGSSRQDPLRHSPF